jgi:ferredoxin
VNIRGERIALPVDGPFEQAAWMKERIARAKQALPNGYCGLPIQQTCPHANACLTCPVFITTPEFLDRHRQHREQTRKLLAAANSKGQLRLAEMNQQALSNLDRIITALEAEDPPAAGEGEGMADAG